MRLLPLLILTTAALAACARAPLVPLQPGSGAGDFSATISSPVEWDVLATAPGIQYTGNLASVKFVVDLSDQNRLYFVRGSRFSLHANFLTRAFGARYRLPNEIWTQYVSPSRRFILGSILHFVDGDLWSFELLSEDNLEAQRLLALWKLLQRATFFGPSLRFRPGSQLHDERVAELGGRLPVLDEAAVFASQRYQPVQQGSAVGVLRMMKGPLSAAELQRGDILVTDDVPVDLPSVAALITGRLQAPLSHVAVLSANRGTPDMALRGACEDPRLLALIGKRVRLTVSANDFALVEDVAEAQSEGRESLRVRAPDLRPRELMPLCDLRRADSRFAGAKAANLGDVCAILGEQVPPGFVVPFAFYADHLRGAARELAALNQATAGGDLDAKLRVVRARIASLPVDAGLLMELQRGIRALTPDGKVRLRSSTNAEDLPGFNGAGLYDSEILEADASDAELAGALSRVWASVWNLRAYQERGRHGISHTDVAMAVLVQRSIDEASANGVALSRNPFDPERPAVYINAQGADSNVTGARGDELPEQWLLRTFLPVREPQRLSPRSTGEGPVLQRSEILELAVQVERLHEHFRPSFAGRANSVDVEWLLDRQRRLHIVQVRPYFVRYGPGN